MLWLKATLLWLPLFSAYLYMSHKFHPRRKHEHHEHHKHHLHLTAFLLIGDDGMSKFLFTIAAPSQAGATLALTFTGKEASPVTVAFVPAAADATKLTAETGDLTGSYVVGDPVADATMIQTTAHGTAGPAVPCPFTLTDGLPATPADVSTLTAALVP